MITGASSGIGAEIAREYARRGVPLILTARREDRLAQLADELRARVPIEIISADLADPTAPARLCDEIERRRLPVRILVNNAGYGVPGRYRSKDWKTHADFLQVMLGATSELTWRLLPSICAHGQGRIINVASFAALVPAADGQTLYAPAKAYLVKFSEALSLENADRGVHVTALCPGFTWSEFHDVTGTRAMMSKLPKWMWLHADAVARAGIDAAERGQVVVVPGAFYKTMYCLIRHLPDSWALKLMGRNSGKIRKVD
ncbi:SDR family oxidoreductase [Luteimonas sp. SX5]|uniref:SDR family oxidoreductase n=1 Tax=Luteimonas galliterrae TaxID=2940486 RepID=A0ABT0MEM6_9GAMM|nr:SDR family oxidoreductase [Luteimonas galliterrae]MCL1633320.1 SDR family oxidoreductase [Luteimonas galliterrae]